VEAEEGGESAKLNLITSKLHLQISRKIAVENTIPIVIRLKHLLESRHSPLLRNLMLFLRDLVRDFRVEMDDVTAGDRQLARELEFDLRRLKETEARLERSMADKDEGSSDGNVAGEAEENVPPQAAAAVRTPLRKSKITMDADQTQLRSCLSVPRLRGRSKKVCFASKNSSPVSKAK
jgi:condensin-2 complex subunit D3